MYSLTARSLTAVVASMLLVAPEAAGQTLDTTSAAPEVRVVPGEHYRGNALLRFLVGDNYRVLWQRPLVVPVLDLDTFGGGLEVEKAGGNQSWTLHFNAPDGRTWIFRSVDKFPSKTLSPDVQGTVIDDVIHDHVSSLHPGGAFVAEPLASAAGLLAVQPVLRVMPDDPALGEHREVYAGMLGQMVERPNEGENDEPLYGGFSRIVGTDELLDKLEEDPRHRVDSEEFLKARLLDFVVGDPDRGPDQWRWARVPGLRGFRWRPIIRDRDWAFMDAGGPLPKVVSTVYPKMVEYGPEFSSLESLTVGEQDLGRRLLTDLDRADFERAAESLRRALTDEAIHEAVAALPDPQKADHAEWLARSIRGRRDALPAMAAGYYRRLASEVDVRATDRSDRAEIVRRTDGSLDVTLFARVELLVAEERPDDEDGDDAAYGNGESAAGFEEPDWVAYYSRRFLPVETEEVRVYLHGGDDLAMVRPGGPAAITVRVIGGGGDDRLIDETDGRGTAFYDARGENELRVGSRTRVSARDFEPAALEDWVAREMGTDQPRDWGREQSWFSPAFDYREGAGVILGAGPTWTAYGFRREPYASRVAVRVLWGTRSGGLGMDLDAEVPRENSPFSYTLHARGTQFEAIRFYGFGNDSPALDAERTLVMQSQIRVAPALAFAIGAVEAELGPVAVYTSARPAAGGPAATLRPLGSGDFGHLGGRAALEVDLAGDRIPTRGVRFAASAEAYPGVWDAPGAFGHAAAEARGYLTAPVGPRPTLALRLGGSRAWGSFPVHEAAFIGGGSSLRGYRWQRFTGDAAVYGGAELRVPLFRMELITKGRLGVLGLADAGRVYVDGESFGGWHTGHGAGLWFESLDRAVYFTWARGEQDRFYVGLGLPF